MIVATPFAMHDSSRHFLSPAPLHRAICIALLPWLSEEGGLVLEGSVQRHRGRLRMHAWLVDRATHQVRHTFRFDGAAVADDGCNAALADIAAALAAKVEALGLLPQLALSRGYAAGCAATYS